MSDPMTIGRFMTPMPLTIGADQPLSLAHEIMRSKKIRHLPVLRNGDVVGIVTQRDLALIETLEDVDPAIVTVDEAMTPEPYLVRRSARVEQVARHMAAHKYGCCVVVERGHVVGIFTTVDALALLADLIKPRRAA